ncbi:diamine N-acetyltransferase [Muriicola jejuensis]|uniref:GNAT family N-acetyltransferase n=1 Tax=Muriicola jejuensis TaxID=504488 RepID=A0A6P0UIX2_9FLAO|nr:GNAT family N-acetyltransferase [Muriicola jejuensis]NER11043.1 GNAT family N-acetyltransferase [Muriicola jejuensis]SMP23170.1 diamine N-acetyltransferase [Muriicola jejuensis]
MIELKGEKVVLRALEPEDLDFLYLLENDTRFWEVSGTQQPYSRHVLKQYLENAHRDIYEVKQMRMAIIGPDGDLIGLIDLFDFDPKNLRVGLGLVVRAEEDRNKGFGAEAIELIVAFAFKSLNVRQVYAHILEDNLASMRLFEKSGFIRTATKKDWIRWQGEFRDQHLYQKINPSCT